MHTTWVLVAPNFLRCPHEKLHPKPYHRVTLMQPTPYVMSWQLIIKQTPHLGASVVKLNKVQRALAKPSLSQNTLVLLYMHSTLFTTIKKCVNCKAMTTHDIVYWNPWYFLPQYTPLIEFPSFWSKQIRIGKGRLMSFGLDLPYFPLYPKCMCSWPLRASTPGARFGPPPPFCRGCPAKLPHQIMPTPLWR